MKNISKSTVWFVFLGLVIANIYIFMSGVALGNQINHFETEIGRLKQVNMDLERKAYAIDSLDFAAKMAVRLDFTKKSTPLYLENLKYAFNQ